MNTASPDPSAPNGGRAYWRSLDELASTPEFRQWLEREFPEGASEWTDPVTRRHFMKIMSASFLLAGLGVAGTGCRRPEQKIVPFAKMPENYVHGVPQYYATAMPTRDGAIPLVVRSNDGRPTKVEGNDRYPGGSGTDRYAQASILNLYDPDRAGRFVKDGATSTPEAAMDFLTGLSRQAQSNQGQGLAFLLGNSNSPSRLRLQQEISTKFPQARWFRNEAIDTDIHRRAASAATGQAVAPVFRYDLAKVIVSLDSDFLGSEENVHQNIRHFSQGRRLENPQDSMNRLYIIEALMTLTGFSADHRLRASMGDIERVAAALAAGLVKDGHLEQLLQGVGLPPHIDAKWVAECANDLARNAGASLVVAGHRQPMFVHLLSYAINAALGNIGKTVSFLPSQPVIEPGLVELAKALQAGEVETLVILGGNPVYDAPADLNWAAVQKKARVVVRLGYYEDETAALCNWHLPAAHYLESWGDALSSDGTLLPVQPLILPLFGGLTELEVLARVGGLGKTSGYEIVRDTFAGTAGKENFEERWKRFLHDGFLENSAPAPVPAQVAVGDLSRFLNTKPQATTAAKDRLEAVFHRDYSLDDGRYNNNGWLQELPDPITKLTWDNAVLVSRKTAQELGVKNSDVVELVSGGQRLRGPIWIQPGMADYTVGLALGYGRAKTGRVGQKSGFNAYALRTSASPNVSKGVGLQKTRQTCSLSCTQEHWSLEGRPVIREANLEQYRRYPDFARRMNAEEPPVNKPLYPNPLDEAKKSALHQWGMSIDMNTCVGCSACVLACQSENNVPIVGKDQVRRGREMHWLRIDRYYAGDPAKRQYTDTFEVEARQQFETWVDDPQVVTQPMLCQHCEAAPCENVCPVNATVHDQEGLNVMVYNRCVGTRYCSNNCPYKVRRFNYFDYNKRPIDELYKGPLATRKADEWDLVEMIKNPDVTVRMRGVMEKCTFCIQRIEGAKIAQKVKAGPTSDVVVPTDSFTTACAQVCPAGAIVFGNLNDPNSRVSKLKQSARDYSVLEFLLTKPRLTYLAKVRNPNPAMPDHAEAPLTFQLVEEKMGNPFKRDAAHGHEAAPAHGAPEKGAH